MILYDGVTKRYPKNSAPALDAVTLKIEPGEFVTIIGKSGAGKTTLLKLFTAEEHPSEGSIAFKEEIVHELPGSLKNKFRQSVGVVFQDFRLIPTRTARENIQMAMHAAGRSDEEIEADIPYVLELVGLSERAEHFPDELSGGERQRLAIARAIINQPEVILADEPTGNLDPETAKEIIDILKKINDLGTTIIMASHNKDMIARVGKRIVELEKGRIIRDES